MSKEYIQIAFDFSNQDQFEMLVAELSDLGFEGFNEEELEEGQTLKCYQSTMQLVLKTNYSFSIGPNTLKT